MAKEKKGLGKKKGEDLESLSQTHGMVEEEEEKTTNPTTLAQVWGDTGIERYKTLNKDEYSEWLHTLNKSDLQSHANDLGLIPVDSPRLLRQRLEREFSKHVASYQAPGPAQNQEEISDEVRKILSEGR